MTWSSPRPKGRTTSAEQRAAKLASNQHGVITHLQASACGLSGGAIRHCVFTGRWRVVTRGTYADAHAPRTWHQTVVASTLSAGEDAAASHLTAGALLGFVARPHGRIDVTVPYGRNDGRTRPYRVHRARSFDRSDVVTEDGIRVTCPARTLVDIAGIVQPRRLEAALDAALLSGRTSIPALRRYIHDRRLRHLRGVGVLLKLLDDRELGVPSSELEREFLRIVKRFALLRPARQHVEGRYRADFAYVDRRIWIEVDGRATHGTAEAFRADPRRQNRLVVEGWTILRFTWDDVRNRPDEVAAIVPATLCRA